MTRLHGFQSNFHPEDLFIFFRNAVIADKMLVIAEKFYQEEGRKAKIGFSLGISHSGIEDVFGAGTEFCRFVIRQYPDSVLKRVIEANKDIETFCTSVTLELPGDFQESDIETLGKTRNVNIKRDLVVDKNLAKQLHQKLE